MNHLIEIAIKAANKSKYKQKVGAVLIKNGKIISIGYNQIRHQSSIVVNHWVGSLHAEIHCIINAIKKIDSDKIKGSTMIVVRVMKNGKLGLALPCKDCYSVIENFEIKKVIFSTNHGFSEVKV